MAKYIGAHVSASGGVDKAVDNAVEINASAFGVFVKNQRQWNAKPLDNKTENSFKTKLKAANISADYILPHAGYLINLGHPTEENRVKSINSFIDEINRCQQLQLKYINIHPGSHLRELSETDALDLVIRSLEEALDKTSDIKIVLETTAGQGSNLGYKFEHFNYILKNISDTSRLGVCLDTCHSFSAGYNFKESLDYEKVMLEFEKTIGFRFLSGVHLNDTKHDCGSRKDRHELIGKGYLGIDFFRLFMNDERFDNVPIVLETPNSTGWKEEIKMLYNMID